MSPSPKKVTTGTAGGQASHLLIVCASENDARKLESLLRNAGHNVRARWINSAETLEEQIQEAAPDLVICAEGVRGAKPAEITEICISAHPGLSVIWLCEHSSPELLAAAMGRGAADVCSIDSDADLKHFERVFMRESAAALQRRELAGLRERLAASESQSMQLLSSMPDAVAYVQEGILARANPAFAQLVGAQSADETAGHPLMDYVSNDSRTAIRQHLRHVSLGKLEGEWVTFSLMDAKGQAVEVRSRWQRATIDGEPAIELTLRSQADADRAGSATGGAPGRMAFLKALTNPGDRPARMQRMLMFLVVDGFASMEERLGLQSAEEAVIELLEFVRKRLTGASAICRFSSDEVSVLFDCSPDFDVDALIAGLCRDVAAEVFRTSFHEAHLTVTLLAYPLAQETPDSALHDVCREARKLSKQGGNRASLLGPAAKTSLVERELARRASQVKQALEHSRLRLAYQAIASLEGDTRQHQDVLVRMVDDDGQEVVAADFIGAAEKHGLIRSVDRWVVSQIVQLVAERKASPDSPTMFVRISEETLRFGEEFLTWLRTRVQQRPLNPGDLVFELTEAILQNHIAKAKGFCDALRQLGAEVCISHFGATHAERVLEAIPAAYVKFDPNFTRRFGDAAVQKRLNHLLGLIKPKNVKTICSHIEDANLMAKLWQLGINYIQGRRVQEPEILKLTA